MQPITRDTFLKQVEASTNFKGFHEAYEKGMIIAFRNGRGYAVQVDTSEYEWVEYHNTNDKYYGNP